jgi:hypothetical protein
MTNLSMTCQLQGQRAEVADLEEISFKAKRRILEVEHPESRHLFGVGEGG